MNDVYAAQREERQADGRQAGQLIGRDAEMERIHAFLASARTDGRALLVTGDPGVGKTVLLNAASEAASAAGCQVLPPRGGAVGDERSFPRLNTAPSPPLDALPQTQKDPR